MSIAERFWTKVAKGPDCWVWTGARGGEGYGQVRLAPRGPGCEVKAHRLSWVLHHGVIPDGLNVLHRCDNPPCVNPDHLFLGTRADNNRDRSTKGRSATGHRSGASRFPELFRGSRNGRARLTEADVLAIRRLAENGESLRALAGQFGVDRRTVRSVVTRLSWGWLS